MGDARATYRPATPADVPLLRRALWLAVNWRDEAASAESWPDAEAAARYVAGFGRPGDAGVVAEVAGRGVGAAWYRTLPDDDRGYGYVAGDVPEVSLGVFSQARRQGVGTELMRRLIDVAAANRVRAVSLSVEPDNPARRIYERLGFTPVGTAGGSLTLVRLLGEAATSPGEPEQRRRPSRNGDRHPTTR